MQWQMTSHDRAELARDGHVIRREGRSFAEEELLHLPGDDLLCFERRGIQSELVDEHLHVLYPKIPGLLRYVFVDALAQLSAPGRLIQARQLPSKLHTFHHPLCHRKNLDPARFGAS